METKRESIPAWFRKELPIEVREDVSFSAFSSDGDVGIMLGAGETDIEVNADEAAFLFGDKNDLWFMPTLGSFFKVSFNSEEEAVAAKLYNLPIGVYRNCSLIKDVRIDVPVYHDALAMIPFEALTPAENEDNVNDVDEMTEDVEDRRANGVFPADSECEMKIEKGIGEYLEATKANYEEIKGAIDKEVESYDGKVVVRYRPGNKRLYSYDIIEIQNRLLVLTYAESFEGDWLADEEAFNDELPLWFSENDHKVSPVFQAMKCRDFFQLEMPPHTNIISLVVVPKRCVIINDEDMQKIWNGTCNTDIVRTAGIDETMLKTLHEYFASLPTTDTVVPPKYDDVDMIRISSSFAMDSRNWINKD